MKIRAVVSVLALALAPAATAQTLVPFSDPKLPYTFSHPKGWLGVNLNDNTSGVSMVSAKTPPATMIRLLFVPKGAKAADVSLPAQFANLETGIKSTAGVSVKQQSSYAATYGGIKGLEREYLVTSGKKSIKMRVWFGQNAKNLFSFQMTDSQERYAAASALFGKVMQTVKFK